MSKSHRDEKEEALRRHHALNPRPERVEDESFRSDNPFFDPRDLVQVKYEMLRSVREEGSTVTQAAESFGFSRPSFYEAQAAYEVSGLPGLLPQRPGPKRAHKLSDAVVDRLEEALETDGALNSKELAALLLDELGIRVHPRSIERALARRGKAGGRPTL